MRISFTMICAMACLLLPSLASAQKVRTDYDHGTDFSKYKTYKWVKVE